MSTQTIEKKSNKQYRLKVLLKLYGEQFLDLSEFPEDISYDYLRDKLNNIHRILTAQLNDK